MQKFGAKPHKKQTTKKILRLLGFNPSRFGSTHYSHLKELYAAADAIKTLLSHERLEIYSDTPISVTNSKKKNWARLGFLGRVLPWIEFFIQKQRWNK